MNWRNQSTHKDETKAVKVALLAAGLPVVRVGHGTGTAWGWLHIKLTESDRDHERVNGTDGQGTMYDPCRYECPACIENRANHDAAIRIAQQVTGRCGQYDGDIQIN
jgi:hypothetical protein